MTVATPYGSSRLLWRLWMLLRYLLRHKLAIVREGKRVGVTWRALLTHDLDKLQPDYLWAWVVKQDQHRANRLHYVRAPHHPEYWVTRRPRAVGDPVPTGQSRSAREMPRRHRRELLADWRAAHAGNGGVDLGHWYAQNGWSYPFGVQTRRWLEQQLRYVADDQDFVGNDYEDGYYAEISS